MTDEGLSNDSRRRPDVMKKIFMALLLEIQSTLDYQQPPSSSSHTTMTETTRKSKLTYIIYYMKTRSNIQERDPIMSEWGVTRIAQELPKSSYYARFLAILANPDSDAFPLMWSRRCMRQEKRKPLWHPPLLLTILLYPLLILFVYIDCKSLLWDLCLCYI